MGESELPRLQVQLYLPGEFPRLHPLITMVDAGIEACLNLLSADTDRAQVLYRSVLKMLDSTGFSRALGASKLLENLDGKKMQFLDTAENLDRSTEGIAARTQGAIKPILIESRTFITQRTVELDNTLRASESWLSTIWSYVSARSYANSERNLLIELQSALMDTTNKTDSTITKMIENAAAIRKAAESELGVAAATAAPQQEPATIDKPGIDENLRELVRKSPTLDELMGTFTRSGGQVHYGSGRDRGAIRVGADGRPVIFLDGRLRSNPNAILGGLVRQLGMWAAGNNVPVPKLGYLQTGDAGPVATRNGRVAQQHGYRALHNVVLKELKESGWKTKPATARRAVIPIPWNSL